MDENSNAKCEIEFKSSPGYEHVTSIVVSPTIPVECITQLAGTTISTTFTTGTGSASSSRYVMTTNGKKTLELIINGDGDYKIAMGIPNDTISKESFAIGWKGAIDPETKKPALVKFLLPKAPFPAREGAEGAKIAQNKKHQFHDDEHFLKFRTQECNTDAVWKLKPLYSCITPRCNRIGLYLPKDVDIKSALGNLLCVGCSAKLKDARLVDLEMYTEGDGKTDTAVSAFTNHPGVGRSLTYVPGTVARAEGKFQVKVADCAQDAPGVYFFLTRDRLYDYVFSDVALLEQIVASVAPILTLPRIDTCPPIAVPASASIPAPASLSPAIWSVAGSTPPCASTTIPSRSVCPVIVPPPSSIVPLSASAAVPAYAVSSSITPLSTCPATPTCTASTSITPHGARVAVLDKMMIELQRVHDE